MCGIIGYIGKENCLPILINGLKRLEYRGYDSVGISIIKDNEIKTFKQKGKINNFKLPELYSNIGIGHCLHPNTVVFLANGKINLIKDLPHKVEILSYIFNKNKFVKAEGKVFKHKANFLLRIRTSSVNISTTPHHKFLVFDTEKETITEKGAGELKKNDLLILPQKISIKGKSKKLKGVDTKVYYRPKQEGWKIIHQKLKENKNKVSKSIYNHLMREDRNISNKTLAILGIKNIKDFEHSNSYRNFVTFPKNTSPELMRFLGYFIGDGCKDKKGVKFKDLRKEILEEYSILAKKLFNNKGILSSEKNHYVFRINSIYLLNWFEKNLPEIMKKDLPDWIGTLREEEIFAFLGGVYDAEGCVSKKSGTIGFVISDEKLMRSIQSLFLRVDILPSISFPKGDHTHKKQSVKLQIANKDDVNNFLKNIKEYISKLKLKDIISLYKVLNWNVYNNIKIPIKKDKLYKKFRIRGIRGDGFPMVKTIKKYGTKNVKNYLKKYIDAPVIYQRVKNIQKINYSGDVYDIEVKKYHNFIANSIIQHNSRWSTHGIPSDINAHPHNDCKNNISIVHNGIIENFESLKEFLISKGHKFKSDTDSEVFAHLIEEFYDNDLYKAVKKALLNIEGTYGLLVINKDCDKIIAARRGSPLILGIKDNGYFISSDASAIIEHTKNVIYLVDDDVLEVNFNNYVLSNLKDSSINNRDVEKIEWDLEKIEKRGFKHFMLKEIYEQPESIINTLRGRIKDNDIKISVNFDMDFIKNLRRIIITACGTSWHAALIGKYIIEKNCKIPVEVDYASEFRYRDPIINKDDLVIAISQSGETADTLAALREAKKKGAKTLGIVNVVGSTVARECGEGIYLHAGPEIGVASTKAFTSQIIALVILSLFFNKNQKIIDEINKVSNIVKRILDKNNIKDIAKIYYKKNNFLYLGRGINFPVALEGALKLKEISYIHAEGYPAAEMKHGPIALIDEDMPVVVIANKNEVYEKILSNIQEIKARNGKVIAIADEDDNKIRDKVDHVIYVPKTIEELTPIINVIPLQLLAYYMADLRGCDIDKPRNLAKSVTVE